MSLNQNYAPRFFSDFTQVIFLVVFSNFFWIMNNALKCFITIYIIDIWPLKLGSGGIL